MSYLVEDYFTQSSELNYFQRNESQTSKNLLLDSLAETILKSKIGNSILKIQHFNKFNRFLTFYTSLKPPSLNYELLLRIKVDFKHQNLSLETSLIQPSQNYLKIPSPIRSSLCRKISILNRQLWKNGFKIVLNMQNGNLNLINVFDQPPEIFKSTSSVWNRIKNRLSETEKIVITYHGELTEIIYPQKLKFLTINGCEQEAGKIRKHAQEYSNIVEEISMSHIKFEFKDHQGIEVDSVDSKVSFQRQILIRLILQIQNENWFIQTHKLYCWQLHKLLNVFIQDPKFGIEPQREYQYAAYLKMPAPKQPPLGDNKFILNQIQIISPEKTNIRSSLKEGGFNKIYITKVSFYYSNSSRKISSHDFSPIYKNLTFVNDKGISQPINPVLTKTLAIKVPIIRGKQGTDDKYENEFNIINQFKSGVSAYILKYYRSEQSNFEYRKCLMMDYLPNAQPLSNFIEIYRQTLSLNSKVYLITNISNALRFIDDYNIVHMDLNLNNILVCKDYLTKLIDFGESFSKNVKSSGGNTLKRGNTFPFCSPENFERKCEFTIKQDIFSLGMIMYRMFFGEYPFFPSNQAVQSYKEKSYSKKIMLAPERGLEFGDEKTIDLLYRIIFRCLSEDEWIRSEPRWITIFFKLIYFHFL